MKRQLRVKFRRRIERKTDYKARLALLKSGLPRLIVRKTNTYIIAQIVESKEAQDYTICSANSKELKNHGYNFSMKNIPAAYLTGFLIGTKAIKQKIKDVILDLGLQRSTKGSKLYGVLKGFLDAGGIINCSEDLLPDEKRIKGEHTKNKIDLEKIKESIKSK